MHMHDMTFQREITIKTLSNHIYTISISDRTNHVNRKVHVAVIYIKLILDIHSVMNLSRNLTIFFYF